MSRQNTQTTSFADCSWSNRFLALAVAGILFLTMYPFELSHPKPYRLGSPFFLGSSGKAGGPLDIFLNVLLFMPFGFAIGTKLLRRGMSHRATLFYTTLAGALFSYAIEFTQLYVPFRDSGWQDVCTNTTGALLGCVVAFLVGSWIFTHLSRWRQTIALWLTPGRLASVLVIYFGIWFIASAFVTRETSLEDWRTDCFLIFGNDLTGRRPWGGKLLQVQIWNRALPKKVAQQLTSASASNAIDDPLVNFDFGGNGIPGIATDASQGGSAGKSSASNPTAAIATHGVVPTAASPTLSNYVANRLKDANQFSIRAVLASQPGARNRGLILSLSQPSGFADFYLVQQGDEIVFWFRSPVTARWRNLNWKIPNALAANRVRTVLFSYDGSAVSSYIDGTRVQSRAMGVQTAFAGYVRHLKDGELSGYRDIYYALVFFPAGALLGIAVAAPFWRREDRLILAVAGLVVPPVVLEWILMRATRAPFSIADAVLAAVYIVLGLLWMNADGPLHNVRQASGTVLQTPASS